MFSCPLLQTRRLGGKGHLLACGLPSNVTALTYSYVDKYLFAAGTVHLIPTLARRVGSDVVAPNRHVEKASLGRIMGSRDARNQSREGPFDVRSLSSPTSGVGLHNSYTVYILFGHGISYLVPSCQA